MNKENYQFLADNLKYLGFGETLKADLEKNMREGKPEFQLHIATVFHQKPFAASLNFRKSETSGMYFFNSYHASMERNNGEKAAQTFYLNKGKGVTAKEAFNLLDGRSVYKDLVTKEGQPYKAWLQLNPEVRDKNGNLEIKQIHEKYGYDLKEAVTKFPLVELRDPTQEKALMESLQKGNVQSVTLEKDGNAQKMFIEADPRYKTVKLFDEHMKLVTREALATYQSVGKEAASNVLREQPVQDKTTKVKQQKSERRKPEQGTNLLPRKRESAKKGLGLA